MNHNNNFSVLGPKLTDKEFELFRDLIFQQAGISLAIGKKSLVENRLAKRIRTLNISSFIEYHKIIISDASLKEMQILIDLLTTNETYFFREAQHFNYLQQEILKNKARSMGFSVWSAASSTGEEAYSIAMVLADNLGLQSNWQIIGTDINSEVLEAARTAQYTLSEKDVIPNQFLMAYCLKGIRAQEGTILVDKKLRLHVRFEQLNLMSNWSSHIGGFDVIFLRNVMIYFNSETRKQLLDRIADRVKMNGYLFIGHSETLHNLTDRFKMISPSIYTRVK